MTHHEHDAGTERDREDAVALGAATREEELDQAEEGRPSADSPNPTQAAIDEDPESGRPVDVADS